MTGLRLDHVSKTYRTRNGAVVALQDIDLEVQKGEFLCVVGPSGCGKSTFLNIIAGIEQPTQGKVLVDGKPARGPGPDRLFVFQEGALFPWLRVVDNVAFGLKMAGVPGAERRRVSLHQLERLGLERFAHHFVHELSVGMRQRVALARAFVLEPKLLLMDEPFAALDAQSREDLYAELQRLCADTGSTVIFVTHNVREAACLGDRVLVLTARPGRVLVERRVQAARPRTIEDEPVIEVARQLHHDIRRAAAASGKPLPEPLAERAAAGSSAEVEV